MACRRRLTVLRLQIINFSVVTRIIWFNCNSVCTVITWLLLKLDYMDFRF